MPDNRLWESHRLILPEMREKAVRRCGDCRFFVKIQGREEIRWGCVASIPDYGTLQKRVPEIIRAVDVLRRAGKDGLEEVLKHSDPDVQACGLSRAK